MQLSFFVSHTFSHWGMFSPSPDFGRHNWDECRTPSDALIGDGDCDWFAMRGAYWFNAGTQIGCKNVTGCSCEPPHKCCDTLIEPTITNPDLLTYPTWENLSKRVPFPYNLLTTEDAWLNAADASSDKGSHIYFRGDSKWAPISKYNPWNAPGFAPVLDACGIHGGFRWPKREMYACGFKHPGSSLPGECWDTGPINGYEVPATSAIFGDDPARKMEYPPGTSGTAVVNTFLKTGKGNQASTKWVTGGSAEVSQGYWESNHGGGYQYRLCAEGDFSEVAENNEACFQATPLDYASNQSWVEYGVHSNDPEKKVRTPFPAVRVTDQNTNGVKPRGSTWTKMQIPTCLDSLCQSGIYAFEPPVKGLFSGGNWYGPAIIQLNQMFPNAKGDFSKLTQEEQQVARNTYDAHADYVIIDKVRVPNLTPGRYVMSWRWDAEHSAQVWTNCAVIEIVAPSFSSASSSSFSSPEVANIKLNARSETHTEGGRDAIETGEKNGSVAVGTAVAAVAAAIGVLAGVIVLARRLSASSANPSKFSYQQEKRISTPSSLDVSAM